MQRQRHLERRRIDGHDCCGSADHPYHRCGNDGAAHN
jgi:hypothetical protein